MTVSDRPPPSSSSLDSLVAAAERVCSAAGPSPVRLRRAKGLVTERGYRHTVLRCDVIAPADGWARTVVIKASNLGNGHVFREWAALGFLDSIEAAESIAPRLIGGDAAREMLVLEDVGDVVHLREVLNGNDAVAAESALVDAARAIGRLNAETCGRRVVFDAIAAGLPPAPAPEFHQVHRLGAALRDLPILLTPGGAEPSRRLRDEVEYAIDALNDEGFSALTHSDCCPSNIVLRDGQVRLLDFEVSGFRHALADGAMPRVRHLNCMDGFCIPAGTQREMETAYRSELAAGCTAARDDARYARGLCAACVAWTAVTLTNLPSVGEHDRPRGPVSHRRRILASLRACVRATEDLGGFGEIGSAAGRLEGELAAAWPDAGPMVAPVFRP